MELSMPQRRILEALRNDDLYTREIFDKLRVHRDMGIIRDLVDKGLIEYYKVSNSKRVYYRLTNEGLKCINSSINFNINY